MAVKIHKAMKNAIMIGVTRSAGLTSLIFLLSGSPLQASAKSVLNDLHHTNQLRLQLGRLAQEKGASNEVKDFGKRLIDDDERVDLEVADTACLENVRLKKFRFERSEKWEMERLESVSGRDFDLMFAMTVVDDNKNDTNRLQAAQKGLKPGSASYELVNRLLLSTRMVELSKKFLGWGLLPSDLGRPR